jgi:pyruvate formate lyase activating enzyme
MIFSGFMKMDLVNYPGCVAASVFTNGCNMRCPYCHNPSLAMGSSKEKHSDGEILDFLDKRKSFLDGLVISGGEPTLHSELPKFVKEVKVLGLDVKLDTNGTDSEMIAMLLENGLLDYVAMDIKAPFEKYSFFCDAGFEERIRKSMKLISASSVEHEFRTTCPKSILQIQDFDAIARILCELGPETWFLQPFNPSVTLDKAMGNVVSYSEEELSGIADRVRSLVPGVKVR